MEEDLYKPDEHLTSANGQVNPSHADTNAMFTIADHYTPYTNSAQSSLDEVVADFFKDSGTPVDLDAYFNPREHYRDLKTFKSSRDSHCVQDADVVTSDKYPVLNTRL